MGAGVVGTAYPSPVISGNELFGGTLGRSVKDAPLGAQMGVLGKKWTLLILRDVAFQPRLSFSQILNAHSRISRRVLSMRLRELQHEGYLLRYTSEANPRRTSYVLSDKGQDAVPILSAVCELVQRHGRIDSIPPERTLSFGTRPSIRSEYNQTSRPPRRIGWSSTDTSAPLSST